MKKWIYFIVPVILAVIFSFFYFAYLDDAKQKDIERKAEIARVEQAEALKKAEIEEKARLDAERRAAERLAAEQAKEAERIAKWEAEGKRIQDATDENIAEANALAKKISNLEIELNALRQSKAKTNAEVLEMIKQVERAMIDKRNAELEIQRMTEMIARRAADSSLSRAPAAPVAAAR